MRCLHRAMFTTLSNIQTAYYFPKNLHHICLAVQKQPFANFLQNWCSQKFRNIHRKTPVLESLFNKVAGLQVCNFIKKRLQHRYFLLNIAKFLKTAFLKNTSGGYFWHGPKHVSVYILNSWFLRNLNFLFVRLRLKQTKVAAVSY